MSTARQQILDRFRESAIDRLRRINLELGEQKGPTSAQPLPEAILRELHTIKGEARMLGLPGVSSILHELEELLRPEQLAESGQHSESVELAQQSIDRLVGVLASSAMVESSLHRALSTSDPEPVQLPQVRELSATADPRWVHVSQECIDALCNGTAELESGFRAVFAQAQQACHPGAASPRKLRALVEELARFRAQFDDVTSRVWALRLVPIEPLLIDLAYHADELARGQGKRVKVRVQSGSAQLERVILDALREPLLHLVRNAVDHGIETVHERGDKSAEAALTLRAESSGSTILLTICDDGRGVSLEEVRAAAVERGFVSAVAAAALTESELYRLLFRQGFSTRGRVTDLSGRGVGLDVVRSTVEGLGGSVQMETTVGAGTTFRLTLPMRLSRERALVFGQGGLLYAIPARQVLDLISLRDQNVCEVVGGSAVWHRESMLPLSSMAATLGAVSEASQRPVEPLGIIVSTGTERWAFSLGEVIGDFELLRKPCDELLTANLGYVGSATLDDGRLVLYPNLPALLHRARDSRIAYKRSLPALRRRILIVDDSAIIRHLLSLVLAAGGYEVVTADHGRHALLRCEERLPDLIVSDLDMPEMDGMELLSRVRARWPELPCIIFTNHASDELRQRALALGAHEYVVKADFDQEALLHAAERVLSHRTVSA